MSIFLERIIGDLHGISRVCAYFGKTSNPTIVLTDNKSVTRFNQTNAIPLSLWNACDYVLHFNFKIAHIAGSFIITPNFLSRFELRVTEKIRLKIQEGVQTTRIEVTTSSSDVADKEQICFTQADGEDETAEQIHQRKEQSRKKATEWVAKEEPYSMKSRIKGFTKIDGKTTSFSMDGIEANARRRIEQNVDMVPKNQKFK